MERKIIIFLLGLFLIILTAVAFIFKDYQELLSRSSIPTPTSNPTSSTSVYDFQGKIEKIEGNTVMVKTSNNSVYKIIVNNDTQIIRPSYSILFFTPSNSQKLTAKDLRIGDTVSVATTADLKTLKKPEVEAVSINVILPPLNTVNGKIVKIEKNTLTVKTSTYLPLKPNTHKVEKSEKNYEFTVNNTTEISYTDSNQTPRKLALSYLKKDMIVTVYSVSGVTENNKTLALRIEPSVSQPAPSNMPTPPKTSTTPPPTP